MLDELVKELVGAFVDFEKLLRVFAVPLNSQLHIDVLLQPHNFFANVTLFVAEGDFLPFGGIDHCSDFGFQLCDFVPHCIVLPFLDADALRLLTFVDPRTVNDFAHFQLQIFELLFYLRLSVPLLSEILTGELQLHVFFDE